MKIKLFALSVTSVLAMNSASAITTFVGSWNVEQGPTWQSLPIAYTGQEAAALLFGGSAADYAISTVDSSVENINDMAWERTYGGGYGHLVAEDYKVSKNGHYAAPGDTSAYIHDGGNDTHKYTNYAFEVTAVPEPETYAMLLAGLGALSFVARRRKSL